MDSPAMDSPAMARPPLASIQYVPLRSRSSTL